MRRFVIVFVLVVAAAVFYRTSFTATTGTGTLTLPQPAPTAGERAPTFEAERTDGEPFRLDERDTYVLTFWSTLNKDTAEAAPRFEELAERYDGATFAAVYVGAAPEGGEDQPYTVLQDGSGRLAGLYNVKTVPRLFVISDGRIQLVQNGYYDYSEDEDPLRQELDEVLEPEPTEDQARRN